MASYSIPFWKKSPFLRLLIPFTVGIIAQWYLQVPLHFCWSVLGVSFVGFAYFFFIPAFERYKLSMFSGIFSALIFLSLGAMLSWHQDIRYNKEWFGKSYQPNDALIVTLEEPLVEKNKSFKANATVNVLFRNGKKTPAEGKVILYFKKDLPEGQADSLLQHLKYGSQIIFRKPLQEIKNLGNPGGFDYKRYALFQGITHQVYLKPEEFGILETKNGNWFNNFLFSVREKVIGIIRKFIPGEKEQGLAEALLIGYKDDLDQNLIQSYTNTGVVHIIAISGMHLALVYWLLSLLLKPLQRKKQICWLRPVSIIAGLWFFSLLAGAQASVIRSAVMFTCIVTGESLAKKTSIYNTLAFSAFILLCYNPYWLWDVGFQLSYAAVLSIVIFMRPIYNWIYFRNKIVDFIWKLNTVSIAAQILTVPLSIFHFHQFPNYFLLTNFIAVPLSSMILLGEIFLCSVFFIPAIAGLVGKILSWLIGLMNSYIQRIESLPYSLWDGLQINIVQTLLLYTIIAGAGNWLLEKSKIGLKIALIGLVGFMLLRSFSFINRNGQKKIIVYNIPQRQAIDIIQGRDYRFTGDNDLLQDDFLRNFHLKPSRILHRISVDPKTKSTQAGNNYFIFGSKKIMLIDTSFFFSESATPTPVDLLVISKNPGIDILKLARTFDIKQIVFDGSVPSWNVTRWKKDCNSLGIPTYATIEKGAFVMNLQ
ncbi:MAG: ComEC family competence protein [Bacteroidetes bacterium]|nr:ComEC family competence protein [Bacteroidota bacterium]MBS1931691.1 ComEC family competence protein [Bacteroidota bacterium]